MEAVLVPLILFGTTMMLAVSTHEQMTHNPRVALVISPTSAVRKNLIESIRKCPDLQIIESKDPAKDLENRNIEAIIDAPQDNSELNVYLSATEAGGWSGLNKIESALIVARNEAWLKSSGRSKFSKRETEALRLETKPLTSSNSTIVEAILICVGLILYRTAFSTGFAAQLLWDKESSNKSLTNILMTPVNRLAFVAAKCMMMTMLSLGSVIVFQIAFAIFLLVIVLMSAQPAIHTSGEMASSFKGLATISWTTFLLVFVFTCFMFGLYCAQIALMAVTMLRPKQLAMFLTYIYLGLCVPLIVGALPWAKLDSTTQFIPVFNLIVMLKSILQGTFQWQQGLVVTAVSLLLVGICGWLSVKTISTQKFILQSLEE